MELRGAMIEPYKTKKDQTKYKTTIMKNQKPKPAKAKKEKAATSNQNKHRSKKQQTSDRTYGLMESSDPLLVTYGKH